MLLLLEGIYRPKHLLKFRSFMSYQDRLSGLDGTEMQVFYIAAL